MKVEVIRCDVCGQTKGDGNKWLTYTRYHAPFGPGLFIGITSQYISDCCSDTCLQKVLGEVLKEIREQTE